MYPNRYTWYICISMMICTSLQDYLYRMIKRKSIPQTSLVIILTHTHATVKVYRGTRPCRIESRQIKGLSMKHACTCSTSHFNSLHLFDWSFRASRLLSTFMIIFFMLVDTLFIQCALKCKKCATQLMS